jgi:hypothetical protein
VGPIVVVEVPALANLLVEVLGVVDHDTAQQGAKLLPVGAVTPFDLAVKTMSSGNDVNGADAHVEDVSVEILLELNTIIGLDLINAKEQVLTDVVDDLDGGASVASVRRLRGCAVECSRRWWCIGSNAAW